MNTPEYQCVLKNKGAIVETLQVTRGTSALARKYQEESWSSVCTDATAEQLVNIVLLRIKGKPNQLEEFLKMLRDISGLDQIVEKLEETYKEKLKCLPKPAEATSFNSETCHTALGVTPKKSTTDTIGVIVGGQINAAVKDKSTEMIVDTLQKQKTDVDTHQYRSSEPGSDHSSTRADSSLISQNPDPYNTGYSSADPGDERSEAASNHYSSRAETSSPEKPSYSTEYSSTASDNKLSNAAYCRKLEPCNPEYSSSAPADELLGDNLHWDSTNTTQGYSKAAAHSETLSAYDSPVHSKSYAHSEAVSTNSYPATDNTTCPTSDMPSGRSKTASKNSAAVEELYSRDEFQKFPGGACTLTPLGEAANASTN